MNKKYANPPVEEALCEFRLAHNMRWDLTVPGLLYEKLRNTFPVKEQRVIQEVEFLNGQDGFQQRIRTSERLLFFTEDRTSLVQVGPRLLVVNALKPYPHWEGFKPRIEKVWKSLQEAIDVQGLERIGLRYINRIEFPFHKVELSEYFEFYPFIGPRLPQQMASFLSEIEFGYANGRDRCRVQLAPLVQGLDGKSILILCLLHQLSFPSTRTYIVISGFPNGNK
mgnify:CR=1 FL=1